MRNPGGDDETDMDCRCRDDDASVSVADLSFCRHGERARTERHAPHAACRPHRPGAGRGAVVELLAQADTTRNPLYTASGGDGEVRLQQVPAGEWLLRVTSLGYKPLARPVRTSGGDDWG